MDEAIRDELLKSLGVYVRDMQEHRAEVSSILRSLKSGTLTAEAHSFVGWRQWPGFAYDPSIERPPEWWDELAIG